MRKCRVTVPLALAGFVLAALALPSLAIAEEMQPRSWGPRLGYRIGDEIDQFLFGVHGDLGDVFTYTRFAPHIAIAMGDNVTTVSLCPELHYVWRDDPLGENTYFYGGGGLGLHFADYDVDDDTGFGVDVDDSDTDWKINVAAGVETASSSTIGYFGEARVSFIDGTWVEFVGGLNFLLR